MQFMAHILIISELLTVSGARYFVDEEIYSIQANDEDLAEEQSFNLIEKKKLELNSNPVDHMNLSIYQAIDYGLAEANAAYRHYGIELRKVIAVISYDGSSIDHIHLGHEVELNYGAYLIEAKQELDRFIANDFARVIVLE